MFLVNHLVLAPLAVWLVVQIALGEGFHRSPQFAPRVLALTAVLIFAYLSLLLGRRANARLLPCLLATGLTAELLMRSMGPFGEPSDLPWRAAKPYVMFTGPNNGETVMPAVVGGTPAERRTRFNADGFRIETEIPDPKPADELRIFVLGGSTVVVGAPLANTIPGVIESRLRASGLSHARVYNFGVFSYVSGQELALLVHRLIDLEPDLVIAYDGGNDLVSPWVYDPRPGYPYNFYALHEALKELASNLRASSKTLRGLMTDSAVVQAIVGTTDLASRAGRDADRHRVGYGGEAWRRAAVDTYARNVAAMCRVARASGARFAGFFQPLLVYSPAVDPSRLARLGGSEELVSGIRDQRARVPAAVGARLAAIASEEECRFSDLSDLLADDSDAYWDLVHVDNAGNRLVGARIAEELLSWSGLWRRAGGRDRGGLGAAACQISCVSDPRAAAQSR
jgi:lysophospholipase L1-like esterase